LRQVRAFAAGAASLSVTLTYDQRRKSRQRLRLDDGSEAALVLERGTVLASGDRLLADDGAVIEVRAAAETLSVVRAEDPLVLARAAYHLGNRHVPVEVRSGELRYQHDHVLDAMVRGLGVRVEVVEAGFQPEGGAYGHRGSHSHSGHEHEHEHEHDASLSHEHDESLSHARSGHRHGS
jgi:urease accessory protein